MKVFMFMLALSLTFLTQAQKNIKDPTVECSTASGLKINSVEVTDSFTIVHFTYKGYPGSKISIPRKTFIQEVGTDDTLYIQKAEGIHYPKWVKLPGSGELNYSLFFAKVSDKAEFINYGEANPGGSWFMYNIALVDVPYKSKLPEELHGNW
ncbi:MAG: hypothetical protein MI922_07685, partial [Bacteroidales bacterium]|nr:hypothetical protein [Bacteroidales bacterium]